MQPLYEKILQLVGNDVDKANTLLKWMAEHYFIVNRKDNADNNPFLQQNDRLVKRNAYLAEQIDQLLVEVASMSIRLKNMEEKL